MEFTVVDYPCSKCGAAGRECIMVLTPIESGDKYTVIATCKRCIEREAE